MINTVPRKQQEKGNRAGDTAGGQMIQKPERSQNSGVK